MSSLKRRTEKSRVFFYACIYVYPESSFFWLLVWSGLLSFALFGSEGKTRERRQGLLLVSSSSFSVLCAIRWQCERSASSRGEDKPKRDTSITSTEVERERERGREGREGSGYYSNDALCPFKCFFLFHTGFTLPCTPPSRRARVYELSKVTYKRECVHVWMCARVSLCVFIQTPPHTHTHLSAVTRSATHYQLE